MIPLSPKVQARLYWAVGLALGAAVLFWAGAYHGATKAVLACNTEKAKANEVSLRKITELNDKITERERSHEAEVQDMLRSFSATIAAEKARDAAVIDGLRRGTQRLRLPVVRSACGASTAGAVSASAGADGEARAQLAPEAAATLFGITGDGDAAIRQLTALQDYTWKLYNTCQGAKK